MRDLPHPDIESGQTHCDWEWLNEEDGEEDVLRHWRAVYPRRRVPGPAQHESRDVDGQNDADTQNGHSNSGNKCRTELTGILALR